MKLTRFTPSLMPADVLERLFVERGPLLDRIMARVEEAATSTGRNHTLLVGPRGAGKTHLIALAYHRTQSLIAGGAGVQVAWLPEDPWTITTYPRLLRSILERLEPAMDGRVLPREVAELEALIVAQATAGPIVVLVENLDQVFAAIGALGQQRLRHLLQDRRPLLLVASTTRLDRDLSDQARPFYEFFTTTRLEPFSPDVAAHMLTAIALENGDRDVAEYLDSDEGRSRLRVVQHLAGGQPRLWSLFADALTVPALRELVDFLIGSFDDLTPYYQEQLGRLSAQQRLVVSELALADRPLHVAAIADLVEADQRSVGKTMTELGDRGWVVETSSPAVRLLDRRRTYYELAEPLARIAFQLKETRDGAPLRVVVDFLKGWFTPAHFTEPPNGSENAYTQLALRELRTDATMGVALRLTSLPAFRVPAIELLAEVDDALAALGTGDPDAFLALPAPVRTAIEGRLGRHWSPSDITDLRVDVHREAAEDFGMVRHGSRASWIRRAESLVKDNEPAWPGQLVLATWLAGEWNFDQAHAVLAAAEAGGAGRQQLIEARASLIDGYHDAGILSSMLEELQALVEDSGRLLGQESTTTLSLRNNLAIAHRLSGDPSRAVDLLVQLLADSERLRGPQHLDTLITRNNLASAYESAGDYERALRIYEQTTGDLEALLGPEHPNTLTGQNDLAFAYHSAGDLERAISIYDRVLDARSRILGPDHPDTLLSKNNLASAAHEARDFDTAIQLLEETVVASGRVLGHNHPDTLTTRNNLASATIDAGFRSLGIGMLEAVLIDIERVLGPDHPSTKAVRQNLTAARSWGPVEDR